MLWDKSEQKTGETFHSCSRGEPGPAVHTAVTAQERARLSPGVPESSGGHATEVMDTVSISEGKRFGMSLLPVPQGLKCLLCSQPPGLQHSPVPGT